MFKKILKSKILIIFILFFAFISVNAQNINSSYEPKLKDYYINKEDLLKDAELIGKEFKNYMSTNKSEDLRNDAFEKFKKAQDEIENKLKNFPSESINDDQKLKSLIEAGLESFSNNISYLEKEDLNNSTIKNGYDLVIKKYNIIKEINKDYEEGKIDAKEGLSRIEQLKKIN